MVVRPETHCPLWTLRPRRRAFIDHLPLFPWFLFFICFASFCIFQLKKYAKKKSISDDNAAFICVFNSTSPLHKQYTENGSTWIQGYDTKRCTSFYQTVSRMSGWKGSAVAVLKVLEVMLTTPKNRNVCGEKSNSEDDQNVEPVSIEHNIHVATPPSDSV